MLASLAVVLGVFFWSEPQLTPQARQNHVGDDEPVGRVSLPGESDEAIKQNTKKPADDSSGSDQYPNGIELKNDTSLIDSAALEFEEADTLETDTPLTYESAATQLPDTTTAAPAEEGEVVKSQEEVDETELTGRVKLAVHIFDPDVEQDSITRELLEKQSEIKESDEKMYTVEFWQTPFNTAGYKMGNLKLLMYGVDYDQDGALYQYQDTFYLRNFNNFYQLRPSFKMLPLKTVDSTHVLFEQLKNNE